MFQASKTMCMDLPLALKLYLSWPNSLDGTTRAQNPRPILVRIVRQVRGDLRSHG